MTNYQMNFKKNLMKQLKVRYQKCRICVETVPLVFLKKKNRQKLSLRRENTDLFQLFGPKIPLLIGIVAFVNHEFAFIRKIEEKKPYLNCIFRKNEQNQNYGTLITWLFFTPRFFRYFF